MNMNVNVNINLDLITTYFLFVTCMKNIHKMKIDFDLRHFSKICDFSIRNCYSSAGFFVDVSGERSDMHMDCLVQKPAWKRPLQGSSCMWEDNT